MKLKLAIVLFVFIGVFAPSHAKLQRADDRIRRVENGLVVKDQPNQPAKLADRMQSIKCPA